MAALGTCVKVPAPIIRGLPPEGYLPGPGGMSSGTVVLQQIPGFVYQPPDQGQLWPRGDYVPYG